MGKPLTQGWPCFNKILVSNEIPNSSDADLKTEHIKNLMHPQMFEKTGGPINHLPTRAINIAILPIPP
jgi:hypothetical protein